MDVTVNAHAVERFRERTGTKKTEDQIKDKLIQMFSRAKETSFQKSFMNVVALLNHRCRPARYFYYNGWILVLEESEIMTIYEDRVRRFIHD